MVAQIASWRYPLWIGCCWRFAPPVLMPQHDRRRHDREGTSDFKVEESLKEVSDVRCLIWQVLPLRQLHGSTDLWWVVHGLECRDHREFAAGAAVPALVL